MAGRVVNLARGVTVALVRVERRPDRSREFQVAEARASPPAGAFELALPCGALPSSSGERCALRYVVRAVDADAPDADLVILARERRPHLDVGSCRADRLLANWDARHFHIELADARLEGGGWLAGRVHCHGCWADGAVVVRARCFECWRSSSPTDRGMPQWHSSLLWEQANPLRCDPDATWAPFAFAFPDRLPPAVEASTIAWRYELIARRHVRHWFDETAALTPLLYELATPRAPRQATVAAP